jgi:hypothetical protein
MTITEAGLPLRKNILSASGAHAIVVERARKDNPFNYVIARRAGGDQPDAAI